jgi:hypothetical protein
LSTSNCSMLNDVVISEMWASILHLPNCVHLFLSYVRYYKSTEDYSFWESIICWTLSQHGYTKKFDV